MHPVALGRERVHQKRGGGRPRVRHAVGVSRSERVIFFDVDGCLVDSRQPILRSLNHAFAEHGLSELSERDLHRHVGPPLELTIREILADHGRADDDPAPVIASYRAVYATLSVELAATFPGLVEVLDELGATHPLGVVTSKPLRYAQPILDALGFSTRFGIMEGPGLTEVEAKTVTLGRALAASGPDRVAVMVGDRRHDVEAAAAHGIASIGVTWGFGDLDELRSAGAGAVIDHPRELAAALTSLRG